MKITLQDNPDTSNIEYIHNVLTRNCKLTLEERNAFYRGVIEMLKTNTSPNQVAIFVLQALEQILQSKANQILEEIEIPAHLSPTKTRGVFRRVP